MFIEQFFVEGLGCASYLLGCEGAGVAAVVDPDRSVERYLNAAAARGVRITHILETHLHADHVSGNTDLAARTGAEIYVHETAGATFPHRTLRAGETLTLGNVALQVRHTPGHTPESVTVLVIDKTRSDIPWMALTGDTLFVGDAGRPDLVGREAARELAGQMHTSLTTELLSLPDGVLVWPGHGAGSLCGKSIGSVLSTTIGFERATNPALQPRTRDAYIDFATAELPEQPGNHQRIKAINRVGPRPLGPVQARPLTALDVVRELRRGAILLDGRSQAAFAAKHIPGALHLEADAQLSNRVGFVVPPEVPLVLVLESPEVYVESVYRLARVGYEQVVGYLADSLTAWEGLGLPTTSGDVRDLRPRDLATMRHTDPTVLVLDVREPWEFRQVRVPGAVHIPLGELAGRVETLDPARPIAVICASGARSRSAAALLSQKGFTIVYNVLGGTLGWQQAGLGVERG
jgi:glyoxylase-like metal-dependent hydrolase (beta-lactamase superfamily II)/rhodanese-related sulfurtransferase